jgi:hydroxymethylpyrimidine pyrophosphatase-like HAD family hydrolase
MQVDAILLDVDDCIAPAYGDILEENVQKIKEILDSGVKV